ncbi:lamin tail domain-containing protein, partial [Patescibacteria group bacterium]|nr:lamin tail domain-containing protein [Patescibacteria group bacterium]
NGRWLDIFVDVITCLLAFFIVTASFTQAATSTVVISEVMWDGVEYLELYNVTDETVSLTGWSLVRQRLGGEEKVVVTFEEAAVPAGDYFLIEKKEAATTVVADQIVAALTLLNSGEQVTLKNDSGVVIDQANQFGAWFAGANTVSGTSMERTDYVASGTLLTSWHTSSGAHGGRNGTPGVANSEPAVNQAPQAEFDSVEQVSVGEVIIFTAEDSIDPDEDVLTYAWAFGDGASDSGADVAHSYTVAGTFLVSLTVSDGQLTDMVSRSIVVTQLVYSDAIVINEFLANPVGSDASGEFIELKNTSSTAVDLTRWQLDDADGGSSPYTIPAGTSLSGFEIRSWSRSVTKIALNNDGDSVRLFDPSGELKASRDYDTASEGQSYNREDSGGYRLSTTLTPGAANVITKLVTDEGEEEEEEEEAETATGSDSKVAGAIIQQVQLSAVREEEAGTLIQTTGVVSAPPGVLGKTIMYIAGSGIQLYFSQGDFPDVSLGDTVQVTGELSSIRGEARLKLAASTDLKKMAAGDPPRAHIISTKAVAEDLEGSLVTIQGHVTRTSGDTFYLDDGSGEAKVYIKSTTGIDKPKMKRGSAVSITGIVSETTSGYRVLPRWQEDVRLGVVAGLTRFPATGFTGAAWLGFWLLLSVILVLAQRSGEPLLFPL